MKAVLFKDSERTVQKTQAFSVIEVNHLMLYWQMVAFLLDPYNALITLCAQNATLLKFKPQDA
jgi:hypothetical protein